MSFQLLWVELSPSGPQGVANCWAVLRVQVTPRKLDGPTARASGAMSQETSPRPAGRWLRHRQAERQSGQRKQCSHVTRGSWCLST